MTRKEIIDGLKFTVDMFLFDPNTGETYIEPRNDMDKTTVDACKGAIELLEQTDGDLISREVVIEWLKGKDIIKLSSQEEAARKELKALSSVELQPYIENMPSAEKTAEETNLTSEELFALDIEQNVKDIDSGEDDSYYRGRLAGMLSAYRILKGKPYEEGEQTE